MRLRDDIVVDPQLMANHLSDLERDFGLPTGFLIDLARESDWAFIIKSHSLLEAALTQAILAEAKDQRLEELISSLPVLGRHSKKSYAEALSILEPEYAQFIQRFTGIRNHVVHRIEAIDFDIAKYVGGLTDVERKNAVRELIFLGGDVKEKARETFATEPRLAVWIHVLATVTYLVGRRAKAQLNARMREAYKRVAEDTLGPLNELT